jgi:hypothetical protein
MRTRREALAAMAMGVAAFAQGKPNFTGRWTIDLSRTTFRVPADFTEIIDHRDPTLRIETSFDTNQAAGLSIASLLAPSLRLSTTGEEDSNPLPMGLTLLARSHWERARLVSKWRLDGLPSGTLEGTWSRYLDTDGKIMQVDLTAGSGSQTTEAKFAFTKKA